MWASAGLTTPNHTLKLLSVMHTRMSLHYGTVPIYTDNQHKEMHLLMQTSCSTQQQLRTTSGALLSTIADVEVAFCDI